jgi:CDP-diacylglycerol---serine O-phosphatidyltransferase
MNLIKHIPNLLTLGNLFCGCMAIVFAAAGVFETAFWLIAVAAVFDFFDGLAARLLKAYSELGKQLDSLADLVSFGVAPAFMLFLFMQGALFTNNILNGYEVFLPYLAFLIPLFSAIRLARFNICQNQTSEFRGLPTPANGLLTASIPAIFITQMSPPVFPDPHWLALFCVTSSFLMVSNIRLFSLKFTNMSFSENRYRLILITAAVVFIFKLHFIAIPAIILLYIVLSLIETQLSKK